jgi:muramoyltetrapeptide carboxypeptidase
MRPVRPPNLASGGTITVVAPAGKVDWMDLQLGLDWLDKRYRVRYRDDIVSAFGYLAGDDGRREKELQSALDDLETGAVIAARGGFGTSRIIDGLNLTGIHRSPKWVVGSSDLTALLIHLWEALRLITIHGPMAATIHRTDAADLTALSRLLEGRPPKEALPLVPHVGGSAEGPLIGGNLTMLAHVMGRVDPKCFEGTILFLEDVGEKPYRLDRYMTQLDRAGVLERVAGIVLGEFTGCQSADNDTTVQDALDRTLLKLDVPIAMGYPAAHGSRNAPFLHGGNAVLGVSSDAAGLRCCI